MALDVCPNCWGGQEYNGEFRKKEFDHDKQVIEHRSKDGFIRAFEVKYIDGIELKNQGEIHVCTSCQKKYYLKEQKE